MCGPTIVMQRDSVAGDNVYCRACGSEYQLEEAAPALHPVLTGRRGNASALEVKPDHDLIARSVSESARALHFAA